MRSMYKNPKNKTYMAHANNMPASSVISPPSPTCSMDVSPPPPHIDPHWNPTVFALVGSICMLFLLFSYYKFLHKCSSAFQAFTFSRNQLDVLPENPSHDQQQYTSQGLDSCMVHSLPIICYEKKENGNICDEELELGRMKDTECAVCLAEFEEGERLRYLPPCSHAFHVSCIDEWFRIHSSCPLCRSPAFDTAVGQQQQQYERSSEFLLHSLGREDFIHYRS